jgi:hypothetical protein
MKYGTLLARQKVGAFTVVQMSIECVSVQNMFVFVLKEVSGI